MRYDDLPVWTDETSGRMSEVHTVPLWEEDDGSLTLGMEHRLDHPRVVGWCNVALITVEDEPRWFLLTL